MAEKAESVSTAAQIRTLVSHPILVFGLTLLGITISIATWWFTRATVDPVFQAYPVDTVARKESPRLSVLWDGRQVSNLCVTKVALWNEGAVALSQDRFPASDPLRISTPSNIEILAVELANSSRKTLRMSPLIASDKREVTITIDGGDALERGDGIAFRLLFTGDCQSTSFLLLGRVVGSKYGFRRSHKNAIYSEFWSVILLISGGVVGGFLTPMFLNLYTWWLFRTETRAVRQSLYFVIPTGFRILMLIAVLTLAMLVLYGFASRYVIANDLSWIP